MKQCLFYRCFIVFIILHLVDCRKNRRHVSCDRKGAANSFLWKMKRNPPAYFFGTIHVPYTRVWDYIPENSKRAFEESDNVYFELDLTSARTIQSLTRCQMLPRGTDLREVLPSELYKRLKQHLKYVKTAMPSWVTSEQKGKGLYADTLYDAIVGNWERKKPVWVMLMINSLTEADVRSRGTPVLDLHLARLAEKMGKKVGAVERVDEQCQPLNGLNFSQVLFALNHTLIMQEKLLRGAVQVPYTTDDLIKQYNCGDLDAVLFDKETSQVPRINNNKTVGSEPSDPTYRENETDSVMATDIDSYFKNELIYRRNERMAERVKNLLEENPDQSFFFAFGAGHFLGNGSVIDFLQQHGYKIEQIERKSRRKTGNNLNSNNERHKKNRKHKRQHRLSTTMPFSSTPRLSERRHRSQNSKSRQRIRDLWIRTDKNENTEERSYSSSHSPNFGVRVINRYPTAFPPYLYGNLDQDLKSNADSHISLSDDVELLRNLKLWAESPEEYNSGGNRFVFRSVFSSGGVLLLIMGLFSIALNLTFL